jgi:hypothetical protein
MNTNKKYYINKNESITIQCEDCKKLRTFCVINLKNKKHTVNVRCTCGNCFKIDIEFRRSYRKNTNLTCSYMINSYKIDKIYHGIVKNISTGGIAINTEAGLVIKEDANLTVNFMLDNIHKTKIKKTVKVCYVNHEDDTVGCMFIDTAEGTSDKHIYFYLK